MRLAILGLGGLALLGACGPATPPPTPNLPPWVAVTPGLEPIVRSWVEAYRDQVGLPPFDLAVMPLEAGQDKLRRGQVALLFAAAEPPEGWFATSVGKERIAVVVNPDNPGRGFSLRDLERLFSGEAVSWADVQGRETPVQIYVPFAGDDLRAAFAEETMRGRPITPNARLFLTPAKGAALVAEDKAGLGILPQSALTGDVRSVRVAGALPEDSGGAYPYQLEIVGMAPSEPTGGVRDFLGWLQAYLQD
ncbi:MAG: LysR substrate-binding domain-containing protein [Anaerolineales bacterium]|nr:LysR substrate-binding domain-containing protein [Anaerolineales bacterium]